MTVGGGVGMHLRLVPPTEIIAFGSVGLVLEESMIREFLVDDREGWLAVVDQAPASCSKAAVLVAALASTSASQAGGILFV